MRLGENSAVRVFVRLKGLRDYLTSKAAKLWTSERFSDNRAAELNVLQSKQDRLAATRQTGDLIHENRSTFALRRDLAYGRHRRKWLYTQAQQTKFTSEYERWMAFNRLNMRRNLETYPTTNPADLALRAFEEMHQ